MIPIVGEAAPQPAVVAKIEVLLLDSGQVMVKSVVPMGAFSAVEMLAIAVKEIASQEIRKANKTRIEVAPPGMSVERNGG